MTTNTIDWKILDSVQNIELNRRLALIQELVERSVQMRSDSESLTAGLRTNIPKVRLLIWIGVPIAILWSFRLINVGSTIPSGEAVAFIIYVVVVNTQYSRLFEWLTWSQREAYRLDREFSRYLGSYFMLTGGRNLSVHLALLSEHEAGLRDYRMSDSHLAEIARRKSQMEGEIKVSTLNSLNRTWRFKYDDGALQFVW